MAILKKYLRDFVDYQKQDFSNVTPMHRLGKTDHCFYFNSCAGVLKYKPKNDADLARFRNSWLNRFEEIKKLPLKEQRNQLFQFYADMRGREKVKYTANFKTRLKVKVCNLIASN